MNRLIPFLAVSGSAILYSAVITIVGAPTVRRGSWEGVFFDPSCNHESQMDIVGQSNWHRQFFCNAVRRSERDIPISRLMAAEPCINLSR